MRSGTEGKRPERLLDFRSGGWVLLVLVVAVIALISWRLTVILGAGGSRAVGDGRTVESYGFDLSGALVAPIVASGTAKDGLRALVNPATASGEALETLLADKHHKFLVSSDRVIGVVINGEARAYPLRILNWHEVANDTLGGVPIAVTYSPLCDSVVLFDRRVGDDLLTFGFSGLLYNSNLVMYDRGSQSLWSQLQGRAVAGSAAREGRRLVELSCNVVRWSVWRDRHADTSVITGEKVMTSEYRRNPYAGYYGSSRLMFPVKPEPPAETLPAKARIIAVTIDSETAAYPMSLIAERASGSGRWSTQQSGCTITFSYDRETDSALVDAGDCAGRLSIVHSFWFAWYAARTSAHGLLTATADGTMPEKFRQVQPEIPHAATSLRRRPDQVSTTRGPSPTRDSRPATTASPLAIPLCRTEQIPRWQG